MMQIANKTTVRTLSLDVYVALVITREIPDAVGLMAEPVWDGDDLVGEYMTPYGTVRSYRVCPQTARLIEF